MELFTDFRENFQQTRSVDMTIGEYFENAKADPLFYATSPERMLKAIGEPMKVDTSMDPRMSRIFLNRTILTYPAFADFYGMEETIERIVGYFRHAAQGLEERKQILYLLGPVGAAKSSLAERLKHLMEMYPIYVLTAKGADGKTEMSPVFESPLNLFSREKYGARFEKEFHIDPRYLNQVASPWAVKKLAEFQGDIRKFGVAKVYPSILNQIGITKTEPGDENNQDISTLVGKTDIRKLDRYSQTDPESYSFSGGLCRSNQGLMEFVEMFKAPIKVLHPLLTATQEGNYVGTEAIGAIPFNGTILAHSNESEWQLFRSNKNNEAFIDRVCVIKVPYCLRRTEEESIYKKMLDTSSLKEAHCAPETLKLLAQFCVMTRLKDHENSNIFSKMRVYDGENMRETDPRAKNIQEYRDVAGVDEGMSGVSTRFAFKALSKTFNHDTDEVSADPVHLFLTLEDAIRREQFPADTEDKYLGLIKDYLTEDYKEFIGNEIQTAYLESYDDYGQNLFDRYITYADHWMQEIEYKDPDTGTLFNRDHLNAELEKIEKPAGISGVKDFRYEVVNFVIRQKAARGKPVKWTSYEKLKKVIEKKMFSSVQDLLPVISFGAKASAEDAKKHGEFVQRMKDKGYTERQTRRLVEWYMRVSRS